MVLLIGSLLAAGAVFGQLPAGPAARPAFDVASVKRSTDPIAGILRVENGNFTYGNGLRLLIAWAYAVPVNQVIAPEWTLLANTVVVAKAGRPVTEDEVRLMLQTLLEDRFKLKVHRETKEATIAALTVQGSNAPQLKDSDGQQRRLLYDNEKQQEIITGYTMNEFAAWLAQFYHGTLDRTGLPGRYSFVLDYHNFVEPATAVTPADRVKLRPQALDQIGLKLAAIKASLEFVVVDELEKVPAEN